MCGIYLDHQSACPVDPRAAKFAEGFQREFGNPSALHSRGLAARVALEDARVKVAQLINAESPETIIFTDGATEANNLGQQPSHSGIGSKERCQGKEAAGEQHRAYFRAQSPEGS